MGPRVLVHSINPLNVLPNASAVSEQYLQDSFPIEPLSYLSLSVTWKGMVLPVQQTYKLAIVHIVDPINMTARGVTKQSW